MEKPDARMPHADLELFDRGQFQAELALKTSPIAAFKKAIQQGRRGARRALSPRAAISVA